MHDQWNMYTPGESTSITTSIGMGKWANGLGKFCHQLRGNQTVLQRQPLNEMGDAICFLFVHNI